MTRLSGYAAVAFLFACSADRGPPIALPDAMIDARVVDATGPDFGPPPDPDPGPRLTALVAPPIDRGAQVGLYGRNPADGQSVGLAGDVPIFAAELARLLPVIIYADALASGGVTPDERLTVGPEHLRGRGLRAEDLGADLPVADLARRALLDNDRTAEAVLVDRLGGVSAIEEAMARWAIEGLRGYLEPCERDRAFAMGLDPRFAEVECRALGAFLHAADGRGLTPTPFAEAPVYSVDVQRIAALALNDHPRGASSPRAWGQLLSRLAHRTLHGGVPDTWVLSLLDDGLGVGGGDGVPPSAWVGALGASGYGGTHWLGRVRRGEEVFVGVLQAVGHAEDLTPWTGDVVGATWFAVMGSREAWPPIPSAPRHGFHSAWVLPGEAADACDGAPARFDDQLRCRRDAAAGVFEAHDRTAVSAVFESPPDLEVAWFWSDPDGRRRRFQKRLPTSPWWVWTRGHRPLSPGEWHAVIYVNGDPQSTTPFTVR